MICLIALLDQPYRGEMGVTPAAFELIHGQLMKRLTRVGYVIL